MDDTDLNLLQRRVARSFGDKPVADVMVKVRAIVGPGMIPDSEALAQAALEKLRSGEIPDAEELTALEIVIRMMRPVVLTKDGVPQDLPRKAGEDLFPPEHYDNWSDFKNNVARFVNSIGRIESIAPDGTTSHVGTGFLVSNSVLATNRHVLDALTFGSGVLRKKSARVVFKQEYGQNNRPSDILPIIGVDAAHQDLDMVRLKLESTEREGVEIEPAAPAIGDEVVAIGYPAEDEKNNPAFLGTTFQNKFGVRCAALGEVLRGVKHPSFYHDCSTTQGNSGSPLFSLKTAKVIGIHRAGYFMYRNEAIDGAALADFVSNA